MSSILSVSTREVEPGTETEKDYYRHFLHCQKCGVTDKEIFISVKFGLVNYKLPIAIHRCGL